jgi:hypothetical protein
MMQAQALFGTATYAEAVPRLLAAGTWTGAMWAARLTAARESATTGDALSTEILNQAGALDALQRYRLGTASWHDAMGAAALDQYRLQYSLLETQPLFHLPLTEQLAKQKSTEQRDGQVAGVAAVFALLGVGLGAWLGSMMNVQLALLGAVVGAVIAAIAGALLGDAMISRR